MQSRVEILEQLEVEERVTHIESIYAKNMRFFARRYPEISKILKQTVCPYSIDITEEFLDIVEVQSGSSVYPRGQLANMARLMGDWVHENWIEMLNFEYVRPQLYPVHQGIISPFNSQLSMKFPEAVVRLAQKVINLKELQDHRRFSPPVCFLGIFHGLHIDYFLSRTEVHAALFLEPDVKRFEVSCYFVDYEEIFNNIGNLHFSLGDRTNTFSTTLFFGNYHVTRHIWTRILPAYPWDNNAYFVEMLRSLQTGMSSVFYPIDNDLEGIRYSVRNLAKKYPVLSRAGGLKGKFAIAIVAPGPSLDGTLEWLKKNQDRLIIFAIQSAVKVLTKHGVKPDFQFSMEVVMLQETIDQLEMLAEVPAVLNQKASDALTNSFSEVFLCPLALKASPVRFSKELQFVSPSTTNLAVSLAFYAKPQAIYLVGCDLGYRDESQVHAKGSVYDEEENDNPEGAWENRYEKMSQTLVQPNFTGFGPVKTTPFFNHTRIQIENVAREFGAGITCINLSDGARVAGFKASRPERLRFKGSRLPKQQGITKIKKMFASPEEGRNFRQYRDTGHHVVEKFRKRFLDHLQLHEFSWKGFSELIDFALQKSIRECQEDEGDMRLEIYIRVLTDLLNSWYRTAIFLDSREKAAQVYETGRKMVAEIVEELEWPVDEY